MSMGNLKMISFKPPLENAALLKHVSGGPHFFCHFLQVPPKQITALSSLSRSKGQAEPFPAVSFPKEIGVQMVEVPKMLTV